MDLQLMNPSSKPYLEASRRPTCLALTESRQQDETTRRSAAVELLRWVCLAWLNPATWAGSEWMDLMLEDLRLMIPAAGFKTSSRYTGNLDVSPLALG